MSLSGEFPPFFHLLLSKLTTVVKVWSSSSLRRTRPKEPSRSFQPVSSQSFPSQQSPSKRVPGRKMERQQVAKRHPKTTFKVSISISFRADFAIVLRVPRVAHTSRTFKSMSVIHCRYDDSGGRPVRFFLSVADDFGDPPRFGFPVVLRPRYNHPLPNPIPSNDDRSTNYSPESATPLSNSEALAMLKTPTTTCTFRTPGLLFPFMTIFRVPRHGRSLDGHRLSIQVCNPPSCPCSSAFC